MWPWQSRFKNRDSLNGLYVLTTSGVSSQVGYVHVKLNEGISYLPAWLSKEGATKHLSGNPIDGATIVKLSTKGYLETRVWHEKSGYQLFVQISQ